MTYWKTFDSCRSLYPTNNKRIDLKRALRETGNTTQNCYKDYLSTF